ncbi:transporter substrate-binding domain-containing protein [Bradyrhizobium sp. C-145]|uniref:transporter substrate-binding domain-containing protein n=1 Tax=Bradyrhizobium sp. C-145 TaxID=574727 RepID=UPI00201B86E9|nr:transporter substrate-binding domain-containing protein [Bradyrhizobium sp. C-145]UQR61564.1 transporter substrate-binding domain-containing protein [Bradyrhizobium sp. C-145]
MPLKFNFRRLMCGLAAVASVAAGPAYAQDLKKVINAGDITYYAPYTFKDPKTGELMGFDRDILEAMAKKMGATVKWSEYSFADLLSFAPLKTGRVDVYAGAAMTDTPERRANGVSFIDFVYEPFVLFTLRAKADQFKDVDALCGKPVVVNRSGTATGLVKHWSDENCAKAGKPDVEILGSDSSATSLLMLKQGRAEASLNGAGSLSYLNSVEGNIYVPIGKPLNKNMYGMAVLNERKEFTEMLKKALDELIADGTYSKLLQKWGLPDESSIGETSLINAGWSTSK